MARLYADENFLLPVIVELRRLGHDVLTMPEAGQAGQAVSDEGVLTITPLVRLEGQLIRINRPPL